ncbi:MAG: LacI family DNA-binding transcriptional regulator [Anaerolineales bacterium]|nr:LacI family DNA-binding transcriptional regulator [Anaerolineales bacterium]
MIDMPKTLAEIAALAGVSPSTASRALRDSPLISAETTARVQAIATKYNYRPNLMAKNLRLGRSNTIALVMPTNRHDAYYLSDPFLLKCIGLVGAELRKYGYDLLLTQSHTADADTGARYVYSGRADGVVIIGRGPDDGPLNEMAAAGIPLVSWGPAVSGQKYCSVGIDNVSISIEAINLLLALGRKRIGFVGTRCRGCYDTVLRYDGYEAALTAAGLPIDPDLVIEADFTAAGGYKAAQELLAKKPDIDAMYVCSDVMAIAAMEAVRAIGKRVPEDISVIGFDNIELGAYCSPPLTTVSQELESDGVRLIVTKLLAQIKGETVRSELLQGQLIIRDSCGAHRN